MLFYLEEILQLKYYKITKNSRREQHVISAQEVKKLQRKFENKSWFHFKVHLSAKIWIYYTSNFQLTCFHFTERVINSSRVQYSPTSKAPMAVRRLVTLKAKELALLDLLTFVNNAVSRQKYISNLRYVIVPQRHFLLTFARGIYWQKVGTPCVSRSIMANLWHWLTQAFKMTHVLISINLSSYI